MKPYVLLPDLRLTVELHSLPRNYADQDAAIGTVIGRHEAPRKRELEIGQVQVWYYPGDNILEIWECFLTRRFRDTPLLTDENMKLLWIGVERFLMEIFPEANQIVAPWHDPEFASEEYELFLRGQNFTPVAKAAYGKAVSPTA